MSEPLKAFSLHDSSLNIPDFLSLATGNARRVPRRFDRRSARAFYRFESDVSAGHSVFTAVEFLLKLGLWLTRTSPKRSGAGLHQPCALGSHRLASGSDPERTDGQADACPTERGLAGAGAAVRPDPGAGRTGSAFKITLLPAGHIFGSAMSLIEAGGSSLLYTGDFKLRPGLSAETCEPRRADILIMETTYGRPVYQFPPTAAVLKGVTRFCREALDNEETPVLLGYSLGKSQELLCGLEAANLPIVLHGTVHKLTKIYEQFGKCFPPYEKFDSSRARGKVLICPPNVANSALLRNLGPTRLAVLTGWAVDAGCRYRYQAHAAFPLSDHADFPDLLELVIKCSPSRSTPCTGLRRISRRPCAIKGIRRKR